jgi:isopentenyl-diphosphate delta-isomerase
VSERPSAEEHPVVSSESELLILVDEDDREVGCRSKAECHDGEGTLHRAFSVFLFDDAGRVLLQRRAAAKRLWPLYWSNSCCSHPRLGETVQEAAGRRLREELGVGCELTFLYKFVYQAPYQSLGTEYELCHVYAGRCSDPIRANPNEIAQWRSVSPEGLDRELAETPEAFTPWLHLEWRRLRREHPELFSAR